MCSVFRGWHFSSQGQPGSPVHLHPVPPAGQGGSHKCADFLLQRKVFSGRGREDPPPHAAVLQRGRPGQPLRHAGRRPRHGWGRALARAEGQAASTEGRAQPRPLRPPRHQQEHPARPVSSLRSRHVLYKILLWHQTITHETVGVSWKV